MKKPALATILYWLQTPATITSHPGIFSAPLRHRLHDFGQLLAEFVRLVLGLNGAPGRRMKFHDVGDQRGSVLK